METKTTTLEDAGVIGVDAKQFGHGMGVLFTGVAEVFSSLGVEVPEYRVVTKPAGTARSDGSAGEATNEAKPKTRARSKPESKETKSEAGNEADTEAGGKAAVPEPVSEESASSEPTTTKLTKDDLTEVIVAKLKANRDNNEAIQKLLAAHGVTKVSELQPDQFESFMTALAQI